MSLYSKRSIKFVFVNETSSFDESGNNTITIDEVKSTVSFQSAGNLFGTQVSVSLFGLSIELLAALSSKAMGLFGTDTERISMKIFVGETSVFAGYMTSSIANMNSIPNTSLMITATANAALQNKPASPFSFNGATPVPDIINAICNAAGYKAYITGLNGLVVTNPHYEGDIFSQLTALCSDVNVAMSVTPPSISFWPQDGAKDDVMPFISREHGLIGYPVFSNGGLMFQTQFSTLLTTGRNVKIETSLPHASGVYKLTSVTHELSSWMPDGPWHSICIAYRVPSEANDGG